MSDLPDSGKIRVNEKLAELSVRGVLDQNTSKVSKRGKKLTSKQKRRARQAKARGQQVNEILATKIQKAKNRYSTIRSYRKDDIPDTTHGNEKQKRRNIFMSLLMEEDREKAMEIENGDGNEHDDINKHKENETEAQMDQ